MLILTIFGARMQVPKFMNQLSKYLTRNYRGSELIVKNRS